MKKLSQTLRVLLALIVATFSNGLVSNFAYAYPGTGSGTLHEVVCHAEGNGSWHGIPPAKRSNHIDKATGLPYTNGVHVNDFLVYAQYPAGTDWSDLSKDIKDAVDTECAKGPVVTPAAVTFNDVCGLANDTYTVPATDYVQYKIGANVVDAGTYHVTTSGTVTVTASPILLHTIAEGATTSWTHTFTDEACPPSAPSVTSHTPECSLANAATGSIKASITNTDDETNTAVTYTWEVKLGDTVVKSGTTSAIADGQSATISANGLAPGSYTITITGSDQTNASDTFTVPVCQLQVTPCETIVNEPLVSTRNEFADNATNGYTDGAQAGNYEFTPQGVRIWIENGKNAWYHAVNFPLSDAGTPSMDYTHLSGDYKPGLQMRIDFNGDGTVDGTLVGESIYGDNWWLTNGSAQFVKNAAPHNGGGNGSEWYGTLNEWLTAFPSAQVKFIGFSLGTAANGEGVLHSLTFGCHKWTFGLEAVSEIPAPVKDDTCYADNDWYYIPESATVEYMVNGEVVTGWNQVNGSSVTITVQAKEGYYIPEVMQTEWTFTYTDKQCVTISKSADTYVDANHNGVVDSGDYVTWSITLTNTSDELLTDDFLDDHFYIELVDEGATLDQTSIENLAPGESVTLHATKPLNASEISACKASNTAMFYAWRNSNDVEALDGEGAIASGQANASLTMVCGHVLNMSTVKPAAQQLPAELPATGGENNYILLGIVLSTLTYAVVLRRNEA